jgi:hypothetical protein
MQIKEEYKTKLENPAPDCLLAYLFFGGSAKRKGIM